MSHGKRGYILVATALFAAALSFNALKATAGTATLTLAVGGTIAPAPAWQNGSGANIENVSFSFDGLIAGEEANNVDSAVSLVRLINAPTYPADVGLIRPKGCAIGSTAVMEPHVHFLNNKTAVVANSHFSIPNNMNQSYQLRFAAAGRYGHASGAVSCSSRGSLMYTY